MQVGKFKCWREKSFYLLLQIRNFFDFLCFLFFYRNGEANDPLYGFRIQVTLIDNQACDIESTCLTRNGEFPLDDKSNNETDEKRYGELFSSSKPSCQIQNVCG